MVDNTASAAKQASPNSRRLSRRVFLRRSAGAAIALPAFVAACGTNDESVFANAGTNDAAPAATSTAEPAAAQAPVATTPPVAEEPSADAATTEPATSEPIEPTAVPTPEAVAVGPLAIDFVYTMGSGGKPLNPYLAVWIEDLDGNLLNTVALWYEQTQKGPRWLDDLKNWWRSDQQRQDDGGADQVPIISSATRAPGAQSLLWDGFDGDGNPAPDSVVVCVESARERGPHSLSCVTVDRTSIAGPILAADDGELSGVQIVSA